MTLPAASAKRAHHAHANAIKVLPQSFSKDDFSLFHAYANRLCVHSPKPDTIAGIRQFTSVLRSLPPTTPLNREAINDAASALHCIVYGDRDLNDKCRNKDWLRAFIPLLNDAAEIFENLAPDQVKAARISFLSSAYCILTGIGYGARYPWAKDRSWLSPKLACAVKHASEVPPLRMAAQFAMSELFLENPAFFTEAEQRRYDLSLDARLPAPDARAVLREKMARELFFSKLSLR